ncbi:tetratricopeptide repeat protein [Vibrio viridaestus]|uniref:Tetratricopeptide repeat protein n=1 Tax=Vibrio viridaestus TaxID=2487322 RepID=A0A3N9U077_9VIBR|nr:tetratricopeptide repeat protein [Vibrio viridaestus]RQW61046.1 tetratricopeptide repeat protein [Vibrio viridaestus]
MKTLFIIITFSLLIACAARPTHYTTNHAVDTRVDLAVAYMERDNLERARFHLEKARALSPDNLRFNLAMAQFYQLTQQYDQASQLYGALYTQYRTDASVLNNFAGFECSQKRYAHAMDLFQRAIKSKGNSHVGITYKNAAICAYNHKNILEAKTFFETARQYRPNDKDIQRYQEELQ